MKSSTPFSGNSFTSRIILTRTIALIWPFLLQGCVFVKTSLSEEERLKIVQPETKLEQLVNASLKSSINYVNTYDSTSSGKKLGPCMLKKAEATGVVDAKLIRVNIQEKMPEPESGTKALDLFKRLGLNKEKVGALTLGHTIYIKPKFSDAQNILIHEFVHVSQMEKSGINSYIKQYAIQALSLDYHKIPLEAEAFTRAAIIINNLPSCEKLYM